eukprot:m.177012 g.177012  ORF g.177012 m.177012 type:complete len:75 (+) comp13541_c0_seq9:1054-1278(+)
MCKPFTAEQHSPLETEVQHAHTHIHSLTHSPKVFIHCDVFPSFIKSMTSVLSTRACINPLSTDDLFRIIASSIS